MTENEIERHTIDRRGFLKGAGGVTLVAVFGGMFMVACADDKEAEEMQATAAATKAATMAPTAAAATAAATAAAATLYTRLGGAPAVQVVINDFLTNVGGDARINTFFAKTDLARLNKLLVEQVSAATGAPDIKYTGRDMKSAHAGLKIAKKDFDALVEDLVKALDKNKVPEKEKGELLGALGPMSTDIVTV